MICSGLVNLIKQIDNIINYIIINYKMKILLLHGYFQNGKIILKAIQKLLGNKCKEYEIVSPNGPYKIGEDKYGWWNLPSKELFCKPHLYENVEDAIELVKSIGHVDIVIGFSQGAVLATILLGQKIITGCKLVILMSGSDIMDERYISDEKIDTKSIHILGIKDTLCFKEYSLKLSERYINKDISEHKWGHVIPTNSTMRDFILEKINC